MKEIGGYFELECGRFKPCHEGVYVNSGSNALRLVVRTLKIKRIHVPYYTCPVVHRTLKSEGCEIVPYELDASLMPMTKFPKEDFIVANDYFGVTGGNILQLASDYPNLIVDNAQSYFANPAGRATIYSPRKFFGLPDGGIAVFNHDEVDVSNLERDQSYVRMVHLLKRHDLGAMAAYDDFKQNDSTLSSVPLRLMSNLTHAMMCSIDEEHVRSCRLANFSYLYNRLGTMLALRPASEATPMVFPYVTKDAMLRQKLIDNKIFVATYWPGCEKCDTLCQTILPLPIDQRYSQDNMDRILEVING